MEKVSLGTFEITSESVVLSDPCYERGIWCMGSLNNPKKGTWEAFTQQGDYELGDTRNAELTAYHSSIDVEAVTSWAQCTFEVGVDSGQAGIFNDAHYNSDNADWYNKCCDITLSELAAGVLEGGVVSSSGFGDGGYDAFYAVNEDEEIIAIRIVFIDDSADEDESDDSEDEEDEEDTEE